MNIHQEVDYLREENRQLKQMLTGPTVLFPSEWNLKAAEQRLLQSLCASKGPRPHQVLLRACAERDFVEDNLLKVQISNLRKKVKPFGIEIKTVWGVGYELSESAQALVKKHLRTKQIFTFDAQSASA